MPIRANIAEMLQPVTGIDIVVVADLSDFREMDMSADKGVVTCGEFLPGKVYIFLDK